MAEIITSSAISVAEYLSTSTATWQKCTAELRRIRSRWQKLRVMVRIETSCCCWSLCRYASFSYFYSWLRLQLLSPQWPDATGSVADERDYVVRSLVCPLYCANDPASSRNRSSTIEGSNDRSESAARNQIASRLFAAVGEAAVLPAALSFAS